MPATPTPTNDTLTRRDTIWQRLDQHHAERQRAFDERRDAEEYARRYRAMEQAVRCEMQPPKGDAEYHRLNWYWHQLINRAKKSVSKESECDSPSFEIAEIQQAQADTQTAIRNLVANMARVLADHATAPDITHEKLLLVVRIGDGFLSRATQLDAAMRAALNEVIQ